MKAIRAMLATIGAAMIVFGVVSAIGSPDLRISNQLIFLFGGLILHDALLLPVFILAGAVVRRVVPPTYRAIVQAALIVTAAVSVVALPFILGYGRTPDLPSALPRDYLGGYAIVLGVVWLTAAVLIVRREIRADHPRTDRQQAPDAGGPQPAEQ